jgi:hypothetical protein
LLIFLTSKSTLFIFNAGCFTEAVTKRGWQKVQSLHNWYDDVIYSRPTYATMHKPSVIVLFSCLLFIQIFLARLIFLLPDGLNLYTELEGVYCLFSGTFAKLWKVTISFVMSACPSVRPWWYLIFNLFF